MKKVKILAVYFINAIRYLGELDLWVGKKKPSIALRGPLQVVDFTRYWRVKSALSTLKSDSQIP